MSDATKKIISKKAKSILKTFEDCAYMIDVIVMAGRL